MGKMHELLAVMTDLEGTAKKIREEAIVTFSKKPQHFRGMHKTLKMHDDARADEADGLEVIEKMVTTVADKLDYVRTSQEKWYDASLQQEATNQVSKADLIVDGIEIGKDLPATFLLGLESKLRGLRPIFEAIPTQDPAYEWVQDDSAGENVFVCKNPIKAQKTEKKINHKVLVEPTEHHPAQIEKWSENHVIGTFSTKMWTGMLTPRLKSDYLSRIDKLLREVKKARQRANNTEVVDEHVGKKILDYILG